MNTYTKVIIIIRKLIKITKEEYDMEYTREKNERIRKEEVRMLETKYKRELRNFAIQYVALWNSCQSLGLNDRQTKGMIELLLKRDNEKEVNNEIKN